MYYARDTNVIPLNKSKLNEIKSKNKIFINKYFIFKTQKNFFSFSFFISDSYAGNIKTNRTEKINKSRKK